MQTSDWQKLWLGGFCAPGIYGAPIRAADATPRPTLSDYLTLPSQVPDGQTYGNPHSDSRTILRRWSEAVGGRPVWIARSVEEARLQLLLSFNVASRESVLLPANATYPLVEAVKQVGAKPHFAELDQNLSIVSENQHHVAWLQPPLGLPVQASISAEISILDHSDSIPSNGPLNHAGLGQVSADVELYGLHLAHASSKMGALLVFNNEDLYSRFLAQNDEIEPSFFQQAGEQLQRLADLIQNQESALRFVWTGLHEAAGLPLLPIATGRALAHGVAIFVPDEGSPSLFWSYASRENIPLQWMPQIRPVHYAANARCVTSTAMLERWLFVPVSPNDDGASLKQSILGVVKTAEYLGLRWRTNPLRAAEYAAKLDEIYGPEHDAYRPAFPTPDNVGAETMFSIEDFLTQVCSSGMPSSLDIDLESESLKITA